MRDRSPLVSKFTDIDLTHPLVEIAIMLVFVGLTVLCAWVVFHLVLPHMCMK